MEKTHAFEVKLTKFCLECGRKGEKTRILRFTKGIRDRFQMGCKDCGNIRNCTYGGVPEAGTKDVWREHDEGTIRINIEFLKEVECGSRT